MKKSLAKLFILIAATASVITVSGCSTNKGSCYHKVESMSFISSDLKSSYAPSSGDVKMLVIPISFVGSTTTGYTKYITSWNSNKLNDVKDYYFGEENSLASYYKTASFNKINITGFVSKQYQNSTITIQQILSQSDNDYSYLWDMMDDALNFVYDTYKDIDWSKYDLNQDGCIDNIHLITNYTSTNWNDALWPHMFYTHRQGTVEKPMINVYSISGIGFVDDSITAIHEQGHIFGLEDYYDYTTNSNRDYIGEADMQSHNVFDWNSFSKLSMGWVNPYVVDGTSKNFKITISAASLNGDCLIIPANYETWNGSAHDEYFLIELFSPFGNNQKDWNGNWKTALGEYGVRLYHVDARVFGSNKRNENNKEVLIVDDMDSQEIKTKEDIAKYENVTHGANNSYDYLAYEGGIEQCKDYKLLTIIQKGGEDTFGTNNDRHYLKKSDLFLEGDKFTFSKYAKFLSKTGKTVKNMDNGEKFHWEITFTKMSKESVTMRIKYVE